MFMTQEDLRAVIHKNPFQPFRLHIADGKSLRIPHPDFIIAGKHHVAFASETPNGSPGELNFVPYEQIARIELLPPKLRKAL
jgi:hypothetical protein